MCRDIARPRLVKAIDGYTPSGKRAKTVPALGGDFAYLCVTRIPAGRLTRLAHTQVWTALQLIHLETLDPEPPAGPVWIAGDAERRLVYLADTGPAALDSLRTAHANAAEMTVYTWSPDRVRSHLPMHAIVRPIPQYLADAFGIRA